MTTPRPTQILVTGDTTIDWHIAVPDVAHVDLDTAYQWAIKAQAGFSAEAGGASSLAALIRAAAGDGATVIGPTIPPDCLIDPNSGVLARSFSTFEPFASVDDKRVPAWRQDRFLGFTPGVGTVATESEFEGPVTVIVIDDANLGFRDSEERWFGAFRRDDIGIPQFIVKQTPKFASGILWERLIGEHADRLTVYVSAGDLRREFAAIGQAHSWERTASEVVEVIRGDTRLSKAKQVVVSIGFAGAIVVRRDEAPVLIFDPLTQEGDWQRPHKGATSGLGTCVVAGLALSAASIAAPEARTDLDWIVSGLVAGRRVFADGYQHTPGSPTVTFPLNLAGNTLMTAQGSSIGFSVAEVPAEPNWRLLPTEDEVRLLKIAQDIVIYGEAIACRHIPIDRMGKWTSVDRTEIESVRSVRNVVRNYLSQRVKQRPLNLAVFGPPGSGKSFAVKQLATEFEQIELQEFNVSQFKSPDDLVFALQIVRDITVRQKVPLVFWDEFDTSIEGRPLAWVARFLAPMQDGKFVDGGIERPIGPALFVFAGGTRHTLGLFKESAPDSSYKVTDFLSRLRGHIDVLGPDPREEDPTGDKAHVVRRALLLRSHLKQRASQMERNGAIDIDPGVLRAFLRVPRYAHGARSLEAIVEMSAIGGRARYERSALPSAHQLELHVDPNAFLALVREEPARS